MYNISYTLSGQCIDDAVPKRILEKMREKMSPAETSEITREQVASHLQVIIATYIITILRMTCRLHPLLLLDKFCSIAAEV